MRLIFTAAGALLLAATTALAQTAGTGTGSGNRVEEIVVTGSRVIADGTDSPTPVSVITVEELSTLRPGNIVEALNDLPAITGSRSQNSNNGTGGAAGSPANSQSSGNVLNLRQMGLLRTLVLYDGHRAPPSTPDGYVDLDTIPQMLLKRVDVVTGGVSAVYGSDGISGVINLVTDTGFEGIKAHAQTGQSVYDDAGTDEVGIAFGTSVLDGRGHVMGSYETRSQDPIDSKLDRPWGRDFRTVQGSGNDTYPYVMLTGVREADRTFGGRVNGGSAQAILGDSRFTDGGYLVPFVHGETGIAAGIPTATREIGGDGAYDSQQIRAGLDMDQVYGRFDYDFSDGLHGYASIAHTQTESTSSGGWTSASNYSIRADNAYLLQTYRDALTAGGVSSFNLGRRLREAPRGGATTNVKQTFVNAGLQGSVGEYDWELAATSSDVNYKVTTDSARDLGRFAASMDAVLSGGVPVCRASLTNSAYANCVPMNVFGEDSISQEAIDYWTTSLDWTTKIGMQDVNASIAGSPFSSWAGPVNAALSAEWRKVTYEIDSNTPPTAARADCAGILGNCGGGTRVYSSAVDSVSEVSSKVSEAAIEFGIPLLAEDSGAGPMDLNTAYRVANYNLAGTAETWKAGLTWSPLDTVMLRATRSHDFRAPSLDETFRSQQVNFTGFNDWISGNPVPQNNIPTEVGGNPDLKPEFGDTLTYGVVWTPTESFSLSVDSYHITVTDAIWLVQGNTPNVQNACYDSGGSSPYCQLIGRGLGIYDRNDPLATDPANAINLWRQTFINLAEIEVKGIDIESSFRTSVAGRPLSLRLLATNQPHVYYKLPDAPVIDYAGSAFGTNARQASPTWRVTGFARFEATDDISVSLQARYRNSLERTPDDDVEGSPRVSPVTFVNMNVSYRPSWNRGDLELFLNVQNLFNTDPPAAGNYLNPTPGGFGEYVQGDDPIGRFYTVGVRLTMN